MALNEGIVLLHGILRTRRCMARLEKAFAAQGYAVLNIGYPSSKQDIPSLAATLWPQVEAFAETLDKLHFVGFSMGGLLVRSMIAQFAPAKLGRVVMLGTPNRGSQVADRLLGWMLYQMLYGPSGQQLGTQSETIAKLPESLPCEVGVIAGDFPYYPHAMFWLPKGNDGMVSIASTHLQAEADHLILPVSHSLMPMDPRVVKQAVHFIQQGCFLR